MRPGAARRRRRLEQVQRPTGLDDLGCGVAASAYGLDALYLPQRIDVFRISKPLSYEVPAKLTIF
jgi:hypothetical protein